MKITIREPGSAITHFIGMLLAVFAAIPLMAKAGMTGNLAAVAAFLWLLTGGLFYTVGGVIYALKCPIFNGKHKWFGSHEIFHVFVMFGSVCHFIFMYHYVL